VDGDLDGLFWAYALVFGVVALIIVVAVSLAGGAIYALFRPRRGLRAATAFSAAWTAAFGLLTAQLVRLAFRGSLTSKGEGWVAPAIGGLLLGIAALAMIARRRGSATSQPGGVGSSARRTP